MEIIAGLCYNNIIEEVFANISGTFTLFLSVKSALSTRKVLYICQI